MGNFDSFITGVPQLDAERTEPVQHAAILRLAHATIGLSKVAPRLSELAATRQAEAERQAERVKSIAGRAQRMSATLDKTGPRLSLPRGEMGELGGFIRRTPEETRLIAFNPGARAAAPGAVEQLIEDLRADADMCSGDARRQARALRIAVDHCRFAELAYATDERGIQVTENIARKGFRAAYGASGVHKDWSHRRWFQGALRTPGVCLSEIYRSAATDEFCLTASATVVGANGDVRGVVAVDVNFSEILAT